MRVCVFGAGAVGGQMAVRLAHGGAQVCAVVRGANLAAMRQNGLELRKADGSEPMRATFPVSDDPASLGVQDVVVVSIKLAALAGVLPLLKPLLDAETRVIFAMNGMPWWFPRGLDIPHSAEVADLLDPGGAFSRGIPVERWFACVVTSGNIVEAPGVVLNTTPKLNKLRIGNSDGSADTPVERFVDHALRGGYDAAVSSDMRHDVWSKMLINAGISSVATVCERTVAEVCRDQRTRDLSIGLIEEIAAIGRRLGIAVAADAQRLTDPATAPGHTPSFLQDLRAGRKLEIDNGILAVVALARASGIPAPRLEAVAAVMNARSSAFG